MIELENKLKKNTSWVRLTHLTFVTCVWLTPLLVFMAILMLVPQLAIASPFVVNKSTVNLGQYIASYYTYKTPMPFNTGPILSPAPSGGSYLGWNDKYWTPHVTPLDDQDRRRGPDILLPDGIVLLSLVSHEDGFAALVGMAKGGSAGIRLLRYTTEGKVLFDTTLLPLTDLTQADSQKPTNTGDFQLIWTGKYYGAYFATLRNFGTRDKPDVHQSDILFVIDGFGEIKGPGSFKGRKYYHLANFGWRLNVSHSFEQRLHTDGSFMYAFAKGDANPRGIAYNLVRLPGKSLPTVTDSNIFPMPGTKGDNYVPVTLGNVVAVNDGLVVSFSATLDRKSYDVGLMKIGIDGKRRWLKWLTDTPDVEETCLQMGSWNDRIVIGWNAYKPPKEKREANRYYGDSFQLGVLDYNGEWLEPPMATEARWPYRNIWHESKRVHAVQKYGTHNATAENYFKTFPNGDVGWAMTNEMAHLVDIYRLSSARRDPGRQMPESLAPPDQPLLTGDEACRDAKEIYGPALFASFPLQRNCLVVVAAEGRTDFKVMVSDGQTHLSLISMEDVYPPIDYPWKSCRILKADLADFTGDGYQDLVVHGTCTGEGGKEIFNNRIYQNRRDRTPAVFSEDKGLSRRVETIATWRLLIDMLERITTKTVKGK